MGANSKKRRDARVKASRAARTRYEAHSRSPGVKPGRELEAETALLLAHAWDQLDEAEGSCAGPVLIHMDGSFECHGACSEASDRSALLTRHDLLEAVWPCMAEGCPPVTEIVAPCPRCYAHNATV